MSNTAARNRTFEFKSCVDSIRSRSSLPAPTTESNGGMSRLMKAVTPSATHAYQPLSQQSSPRIGGTSHQTSHNVKGANTLAPKGGSKSDFSRMASAIATDINSTSTKLARLAERTYQYCHSSSWSLHAPMPCVSHVSSHYSSTRFNSCETVKSPVFWSSDGYSKPHTYHQTGYLRSESPDFAITDLCAEYEAKCSVELEGKGASGRT